MSSAAFSLASECERFETPRMATKTLVTIRFENAKPGFLYRRDLTLDGRTIRVQATRKQGDGPVQVMERGGERHATEAEAAQRFEVMLTDARRSLKSEQRLETQVPVRAEGLATVAENADLEAAVRAKRDEASAKVWADWLQTQGDVRGELAGLFQGGRDEAARALLDEQADRFLGEDDLRLHDEVYDLEFVHGVLDGLSLRRTRVYNRKGANLAELTGRVLSLPIARLLRRLRFGLASYESDNDWTETMRSVTTSKQAPFITSLRFDDYHSEDCEISWTPTGDFSFAWTALPSLKELVIRSGQSGTYGTLDLPSLERFTRISGGLGADELETFATARWPNLQHLELWTGQENYGGGATVGTLERFFDGSNTPKLTSFGLVNCEILHECLEPLARSKLLPKLRRLDLSDGVLQDGDVDLLLSHAAAFKHLEVLDLSGNQLEAGGERITAALPNAVIGEQREIYDEGERYSALGE